MHFLDENTPLWGLTLPRGNAKNKNKRKKQKMIVPMAKYEYTHHATGCKRLKAMQVKGFSVGQ
ncbi:hypothetical protein CXF60_00390 (plasmid) [Psychrobacter sp. 4Bb]|nr:hypothetical protein CXF60_00390 [Psychrobacter sp. 4Bb]